MSKSFKTRDSSFAFFVNQLDAFDPKYHEPLQATTWSRDVTLRTGISFSNETSSFLRNTYAAPGSLNSTGSTANGGGMPWMSSGGESTAIPGIMVDGTRVVLPLRLLGREVSYTSVELERSIQVGMNIDTAKLDALNKSYQFNTDQMVYIGSSDVGATGLLNSPLVTTAAAPNGAAGSPLWINKTPLEILRDVNFALNSSWLATGYEMTPAIMGLPPAQFSYLSSQLISTAGNSSILTFLGQNSITLTNSGQALKIVPMKWLAGRGVGGTDRMIVYTNENNNVRFPLVPMRRETAYYLGIKFIAPYIWMFGELEVVYPETMFYLDGI